VTVPRDESFPVTRTARVLTLGPALGATARELWIVLHGYGMTAAEILAQVAVLDDGTRRIVAPEALSRFYTRPIEERVKQRSADQHVGASWMTREARDADIADNQAYLLAVYERERAAQGSAALPLTVLGFSQSAATTSRWLASADAPVARHLVWGAMLAHDVPLDPASPLRRGETVWVLGSRDQFVTSALLEAEQARLAAADFPHRLVRFDGGHRLDDETLRALAGTDGAGDATGA
jgi:predicted esterase